MPTASIARPGPARVFTRERDAVAAIKAQGEGSIQPGDIIVLIARGPLGSGMEETYQVTSALQISGLGTRSGGDYRCPFFGREHRRVHRPRRARSAGGRTHRQSARRRPNPHHDRSQSAEGSIDLVGDASREFGAEEGTRVLAARLPRADLKPDAKLPDDTRLWAALQRASGGTWAGCVYDVERIIQVLEAGEKALAEIATEALTPTKAASQATR